MPEDKHREIVCSNHPERPSVEKCFGCGKFFCKECIGEYEGKPHCRKCIELLSKISSVIASADKYDLKKVRFFLGGCALIAIAGMVTVFLLVIIPYMRLGTPIQCNRQLKQVFQVMTAYSNDFGSMFPPYSNDLRPLYAPKYSKDIDLLNNLQCPGTKNVVKVPAHLKDDSVATVGPGMSYFFQGGLSRAGEIEEAKPLLWDQSPENHKSKGMNVLHKDGNVRFYNRDYPEVKDN